MLSYLQAVRGTVAGAMRTRGSSQDTDTDTESFSPESDIDLHGHKLLSSPAPLLIAQRKRSVSTLGQQRTNVNTETQYVNAKQGNTG